MKRYSHDLENVTDYLHHRPPYLLVERIVSLEESQIRTEMDVHPDGFYVQGHFPGAPILPGAIQQEFTTQSAGILIAARHNPMESFNTEDPFFNEYALGVLVKVKSARYKHFARPGDRLRATVRLVEQLDNVFEFAATIENEGRVILRNAFQLMNIRSEVLQGAAGV